MTRRGSAPGGWMLRTPAAALAVGVPLLADSRPLLVLAAVAALLLLAPSPRGASQVAGGLFLVAEVGIAAGGTSWSLLTTALSAAALVALTAPSGPRLCTELGLGAAVATLVATLVPKLPAAGPLTAALAGLLAVVVVLVLLATAGPTLGTDAANRSPVQAVLTRFLPRR